MSEADELFRQVRDDALGAAEALWSNAFAERCDLCNSHEWGTPPVDRDCVDASPCKWHECVQRADQPAGERRGRFALLSCCALLQTLLNADTHVRRDHHRNVKMVPVERAEFGQR